jgi:hypothetical protein
LSSSDSLDCVDGKRALEVLATGKESNTGAAAGKDEKLGRLVVVPFCSFMCLIIVSVSWSVIKQDAKEQCASCKTASLVAFPTSEGKQDSFSLLLTGEVKLSNAYVYQLTRFMITTYSHTFFSCSSPPHIASRALLTVALPLSV